MTDVPALRRLLSEHPVAAVAAIDARGLFVPIPDSLVLPPGHHRIVGPVSFLELVVAQDFGLVRDAWTAACEGGFGQAAVTPFDESDGKVPLVFVDVRAAHGVFLGLLVHPDPSRVAAATAVNELLRVRVSNIRKDERAQILAVDEAFEALLGYPAGEMPGRSSLDLIHPQDQSRALANWMDMLGHPGSSRRTRLRHRHRDGQWVWFEITNQNRLADPDGACVATEMIDISEEMAAQEAVRARELVLHTLTESMPIGVVQLDVTGRIVHRNARVTQLVGRGYANRIEELIVADGSAGQVRELADALAALRDGRDLDVEVGVSDEAGNRLRCRLNLRALVTSTGEPDGAVVCVEDVTEHARLRAELEYRASYDPLTRCRNRATILAELDDALTDEVGAAVVFIDLDGFKAVNDGQGHSAGDELLVRVGQCLTDALRAQDLVGRFGGDEFLVISRAVESERVALELARRLSTALVTEIGIPAGGSSLASIGVAWTRVSLEQLDADVLVHRADQAMYESKREGRGRPVLFSRDRITRLAG